MLGRNCRFLQGPGTDPHTVAELGAAITAGRPARRRLVNYRADGTPWINELELLPVRDAHGELTHYIGVQHHITSPEQAVTNSDSTTVGASLRPNPPNVLTGPADLVQLRAALADAVRRGRRTGTGGAADN